MLVNCEFLFDRDIFYDLFLDFRTSNRDQRDKYNQHQLFQSDHLFNPLKLWLDFFRGDFFSTQ